MTKAPTYPFLVGQLALPMVALINDDDRPSELVAIPRYSRRLTDKILIAFHGACDQGEFDIAARLLQVLEMIFERSHAPGDRRRNTESLVAAHERLWELRHPVDEDC